VASISTAPTLYARASSDSGLPISWRPRNLSPIDNQTRQARGCVEVKQLESLLTSTHVQSRFVKAPIKKTSATLFTSLSPKEGSGFGNLLSSTRNYNMDERGPIMSLQSAGASMYSPKRRMDYAGDFLSLHFPSDDFWQTPKQEPVDPNNAGMDYTSIPPRFEPTEGDLPYGYTDNEIPNMQSSSALQPASNGLGLSYSPMNGYGRAMNDVLSANQAFPPPLDTNETLDSVDFDYSTEQQLQDVANAGQLGFQNAQESSADDFSLVYNPGVDYASMQAISSPPAIYVRTEYNDACDVAPITAPYATSVQMSETTCQTSTVTWNQTFGEDLGNPVLANSNIDSVSPLSGQPFSMQPSTPWNLSTGGLHAHNPASFDNLIPAAGSPFENSPLSSMNVTPLVPQLIWDEGYSTDFIGADDELVLQNEFVHQASPSQDITTSATTAAQLLTDGKTGQSKVHYKSLVSVMQVEIKRESESESLPEDYQPRMDELVGNFDSNPNAASRKRKRSKFTTENAEKVRGVRKNGACVACHQRKTPVITLYVLWSKYTDFQSALWTRCASIVLKLQKVVFL
jgi:hypothetical protein